MHVNGSYIIKVCIETHEWIQRLNLPNNFCQLTFGGLSMFFIMFYEIKLKQISNLVNTFTLFHLRVLFSFENTCYSHKLFLLTIFFIFVIPSFFNILLLSLSFPNKLSLRLKMSFIFITYYLKHIYFHALVFVNILPVIICLWSLFKADFYSRNCSFYIFYWYFKNVCIIY